MKLKLFLFLGLGCFHFTFASAGEHEIAGAIRRPQAVTPAESGPRRGPSVISAPLMTESFEREGFYYFSFKLNGRTKAYKVSSEGLLDGIYLLGRDTDSSPLMVSFFSGMKSPVYLEKASIEEAVPALAADALTEISWQEFSDSKN